MTDSGGFEKVRSFSRILLLCITAGIGGAVLYNEGSVALFPELIGFVPACGVAWVLSGWLARGALRPMPSTVERGMVVGLAVAAVASIGLGLTFAGWILAEARQPPSVWSIVTTYIEVVCVVAACCAVPGIVLGAVFGLAVQARADSVRRKTRVADGIGIA